MDGPPSRSLPVILAELAVGINRLQLEAAATVNTGDQCSLETRDLTWPWRRLLAMHILTAGEGGFGCWIDDVVDYSMTSPLPWHAVQVRGRAAAPPVRGHEKVPTGGQVESPLLCWVSCLFPEAVGLDGDGDSANCHPAHHPGSSIEVRKGNLLTESGSV